MTMKILFKLSLAVLLTVAYTTVSAQTPSNVMLTEAADPNKGKPLDDIVERVLVYEKQTLDYEKLREADVFWQRRIWRLIDVREKMNLPFSYPERPFVDVLLEATENLELTAYADEKFEIPMSKEDIDSKVNKKETVSTIDPESGEEIIKEVVQELNPEDIKQFRVKEVWFFEEESSTFQKRILGIAPIRDAFNDSGDYMGQEVLFWVYYPEARKVLAREKAYNMFNNDSTPMTWEDIFEMRFFASYIYKESNVYDRRLEEFLSGLDLLMESGKIKDKLFSYEHDLWAY
ncbi:MAG: gliding motility protein GldN [Saprospiraceae bacterium]|nr:gliding motility protein GldN [Saprospiraceae bacterium]MDP4821641.1 gliding motility protein GldN [Saprospiraceae bacterium]MDP4997711.1 gliding motility protein GldN [Saprospiraceae bacterium]